MYALAVILGFGLAASIGALAALVVSGNLSGPTGEGTRPGEPSPAGERGKPPKRQQPGADGPQQEHTDRSQQEKSAAKREQIATQDKQISYVSGVREIQADSVVAFSDSHEKLLRYDTLTSGDIEEMQANHAALREFADQASDLQAPQKLHLPRTLVNRARRRAGADMRRLPNNDSEVVIPYSCPEAS